MDIFLILWTLVNISEEKKNLVLFLLSNQTSEKQKMTFVPMGMFDREEQTNKIYFYFYIWHIYGNYLEKKMMSDLFLDNH